MATSEPVLIDAGWVLACTDDDDLVLRRDHTVIVEDDRIVDVTPTGSTSGVGSGRVDASGHLVLAGLISGHTHVAGGTVTRGIIEGGRNYARPLELAEQLQDDELDAVTAHNLAELVRGGCTTQVEMSLSMRQAESYVRVAERWGVRGYPSVMVPGIGRLFEIWRRVNDQVLFESVPATLDEITAALEFCRRHNDAAELRRSSDPRRNFGGRIRPQMGLHATDTHTPETMRAFADAARQVGNGIHLHLSQGEAETATVERLWGKRPVEWIDEFGFYDGPLFAAHLVGVDLDADPALLAATNATCVHCPSAGGAGGRTQPWAEFLGAGARTNIGIDTHSNDLLENVKLAVLYGQARYELLDGLDTRPMRRPTILDAVRATTIDAADGLGRNDLGRIRAGAMADLITVDVTGLLVGSGALPPEPLHNLLYAHGRCVRDVMIDGTFLVRNGRLIVDDEDDVVRRGAAAVSNIWDRLAAEGWFAS